MSSLVERSAKLLELRRLIPRQETFREERSLFLHYLGIIKMNHTKTFKTTEER